MPDAARPSPATVLSGLWPLRVAWFALPLLAGPAIGDALRDRSDAVQTLASALAWVGWAAVLVASAVPRATTLTVVHVLVPGATAATAWSVIGADRPGWAAVAVGAALVTLFLSLAPSLADAFVDGSSYGPERRVSLRVPASLLLGPLPLAWLVLAAGAITGPMLLAAEQWVAGGLATVVGLPVAVVVGLRMHTLSRRWLVFVPAGVVVHDPLLLAEPVLLQRHLVARFAPAPADAAQTAGVVDVTGGALGLVLELRAAEPITVGRRAGREANEVEGVQALLVSPGRPATALEIALEHRLPVGA